MSSPKPQSLMSVLALILPTQPDVRAVLSNPSTWNTCLASSAQVSGHWGKKNPRTLLIPSPYSLKRYFANVSTKIFLTAEERAAFA